MNAAQQKSVLLIGASRGLGYGMAEEYLARGWRVVATKRAGTITRLDELAASADHCLEIETLDIDDVGQISGLRTRLAARQFDMLFVNAGVMDDGEKAMDEVTTDEFVRVMVTNALSPMRVIGALHDLVSPTGIIGVMSAGFGSIAGNETGGCEVYRASKAALNISMRSFFARHRDDRRTLLIMTPGWVRTDMGGAVASLSIEKSVSNLVATIESQTGKGGLQFLNYLGVVVPW